MIVMFQERKLTCMIARLKQIWTLPSTYSMLCYSTRRSSYQNVQTVDLDDYFCRYEHRFWKNTADYHITYATGLTGAVLRARAGLWPATVTVGATWAGHCSLYLTGRKLDKDSGCQWAVGGKLVAVRGWHDCSLSNTSWSYIGETVTKLMTNLLHVSDTIVNDNIRACRTSRWRPPPVQEQLSWLCRGFRSWRPAQWLR